jgi:ABC-type transporter Mla maintaining outer membrane lipid asymmetry ATPase subunit MlaF
MLNEGSIVIEGTLKDLEQSDDPFVAKFMHESGKEN